MPGILRILKLLGGGRCSEDRREVENNSKHLLVLWAKLILPEFHMVPGMVWAFIIVRSYFGVA